ncbi:MAG: phosphoribosylanthranilate isomerase [Lachnospiraceae bacterium]|nr:phosphoribosylanthranilate isomerase [Lachnospiraceae bacterium]
MSIVKICGLKTKDEIRWTAEAEADLGGIVVFYPKSKRNVEISEAEKLTDYAKSLGLKTVAVTVSPDAFAVSQIIDAGFDYIQIHGELAGDVLDGALVPVIRAFNVSNMHEFEKYKSDERIWGFIFDAGIPGSGMAFDYALLKELRLDLYKEKPILLAGGLNPLNVGEALKETGLCGADTSSGVEDETGLKKSREKIFSFVRAVRKS